MNKTLKAYMLVCNKMFYIMLENIFLYSFLKNTEKTVLQFCSFPGDQRFKQFSDSHYICFGHFHFVILEH